MKDIKITFEDVDDSLVMDLINNINKLRKIDRLFLSEAVKS